MIILLGKASLIAIAQMTATSNKAENFTTSKKLVEEASGLGAKVRKSQDDSIHSHVLLLNNFL